MEGFWCGKQALVRSVDLKVLCNVTLRTVSGWEHSSTKQLERVPRGSFGGATCKYTVSVSIIDRSRAVLKKQMRQVSHLSLFLLLFARYFRAFTKITAKVALQVGLLKLGNLPLF